ncbi:protein MANBAL isoform X1 [Myotis daubentonii]|uniref:protein MANBAL isoform X1 n=2 Tax=Myotis daubentonii TaxID=98922 RepID=UPI002872CC27|nr:protein MANBAL isoform X1 [Myotis daubentonii]
MGFPNRSWLWSVVSPQRRPQIAGAMASDLDFSPPEVPEPTFLENLLRYGLFLGAIFQLICVLAIIIPVPKSHEAEAEPSEPRSGEVRKPKAAAPSANKRPKKEAKKKR